MDIVSTPDAPAAIGPYSQAIVSGGIVYCSGQIPLDPGTMELVGDTAAEQCEQVMKNLSDMMRPGEKEEMNYRLSPVQGQSLEDGPKDDGIEIEIVSFTGMSLRKSLRLLQGSNVEIEVQGTGRVVSQHPPAGTKLKPGARVTLILERDAVDPGYRRPQITEPE